MVDFCKPTRYLYTYCYKDNIVVRAQESYSGIYQNGGIGPACQMTLGFINCPQCQNQLAFGSKDTKGYERLFTRTKMDELETMILNLETRITQIEYSPPPSGGPKFKDIYNEAKEAGDFS